MTCSIYSMLHGKIVVEDIKYAIFRGYEVYETEIYRGHAPTIGEINSVFYLIKDDGSARQYDISIGYYEFRNDNLTIVASF